MESAYGQDYYQSPSDAIYRPHNRALIVLSHVLYKEKHTPTLMAYIGNFHIPKPYNRNVSLIYHTK